MSTEKQLKFAQPRGSQNFYNNFIDVNAQLLNTYVNTFKKKEYFFGYIFLFSYKFDYLINRKDYFKDESFSKMDQKNIIEVWADLNVWPEFHRPSYLVMVNEKNIIYWVPENYKKLYHLKWPIANSVSFF